MFLHLLLDRRGEQFDEWLRGGFLQGFVGCGDGRAKVPASRLQPRKSRALTGAVHANQRFEEETLGQLASFGTELSDG